MEIHELPEAASVASSDEVAIDKGTMTLRATITKLLSLINFPVRSVNNQTGDVSLPIPTKTSDLTNDSNFVTQNDITFPVTSVNGMTGDVIVQGGGGSDEVFIGTFGTTTYSELSTAITAGKLIYINKPDSYGVLLQYYYIKQNFSNEIRFYRLEDGGTKYIWYIACQTNDVWKGPYTSFAIAEVGKMSTYAVTKLNGFRGNLETDNLFNFGNDIPYEEFNAVNSEGTYNFKRYSNGMVSLDILAESCANTKHTLFPASQIPKKYLPAQNVYLSGYDSGNKAKEFAVSSNPSTGGINTYQGTNVGLWAHAVYPSAVGNEFNYVVPLYYREPVRYIGDLINNYTSSYDVFLIVTDTHTYRNQLGSQAIIRYLIDNYGDSSALKYCFWLGDVTRDSYFNEDQYKAYRQPLLPISDDVYFALGNHERSGTNMDYTNNSLIYDEFMADKNVTGVKNRYYYYFDNTSHKIRYIVINTNEVGATAGTSGYTMSQEQLTWLRSAVVLPASDWNLVVLGHCDINTDVTFFGQYTCSNGDEVKSILASTNGRLVGYFCGHEHCDHVSDMTVWEDAGGGELVERTVGKQFVLMCDEMDPANAYASSGVEYPVRVAGENTDQAVTVVAVNCRTRKVYVYRIGAFAEDYVFSQSTSSEGLGYMSYDY